MPRKILVEKEGEADAPTSDNEVVVTQPAEVEENTDETLDPAPDEEGSVEEEVIPSSLKSAGMTHCTTLRRLHMHDKIYEIGEDIVLSEEQALALDAKGNVTIVS